MTTPATDRPTDPHTGPPRDEVLVVGAGPCGLATACELLRYGVPVRVLDAAPEPRAGSRAILLWPPALEVLRAAGVLDEAERRGVRATAMNYRLGGGRTIRVRLDPQNRPLLLPQADTEAVLEGALRALGGTVERSVRVTDVARDADGVRVTAAGPAGTETISAGWLVGADGVRSVVRDRLGVDFDGEPFPDTILVAEGQVEGELDHSQLHYYLGAGGGALLVPLPGGRFRLGTPVAPGTEVTQELVDELLARRGPGGLRMHDLSVRSTFSAQERVAATLRVGRCFLVGDAAHTHSAIGGQGLNLGLQDVRNLSWKLAGVVTGQLREEVLDTYDAERRHAAEQTVRDTHRLARLTLAGPVLARVRNGLLRALDRSGVLQRAYPPKLAGWQLRYPEGPLVLGSGGGRRDDGDLPAPGARTPSWVPGTPAGGALLRLATFGDGSGDLARRAAELAAGLPDLLGHEHLTPGRSGFLVLRPDGYVAARGHTTADLDAAAAWLAGLRATSRTHLAPSAPSAPSIRPVQEKS